LAQLAQLFSQQEGMQQPQLEDTQQEGMQQPQLEDTQQEGMQQPQFEDTQQEGQSYQTPSDTADVQNNSSDENELQNNNNSEVNADPVSKNTQGIKDDEGSIFHESFEELTNEEKFKNNFKNNDITKQSLFDCYKKALSKERDYSCVLINLPEEAKNKFKSIQVQIDEVDVYTEDDHGLEDQPHVTALYGIHEQDFDKVQDKIDFQGPVYLQVNWGKLGVFSNDKYDVLHATCELTDSLGELNQYLKDTFEYTSAHPVYNPHCTIAYLKKGKGVKYKKLGDGIQSTMFDVELVTFSDSASVHKDLVLKKKEKKAYADLKVNPPDTRLKKMDADQIQQYVQAYDVEKQKYEQKKNPYGLLTATALGVGGLGAASLYGANQAGKLHDNFITPEDMSRLKYLEDGKVPWTKDQDFSRIIKDYSDRSATATRIRIFDQPVEAVLKPLATWYERITDFRTPQHQPTKIKEFAKKIEEAMRTDMWDDVNSPIHYRRFSEGPATGYLHYMQELINTPDAVGGYGAGFKFGGPYTALNTDASALQKNLAGLDIDNMKLDKDSFLALPQSIQDVLLGIDKVIKKNKMQYLLGGKEIDPSYAKSVLKQLQSTIGGLDVSQLNQSTSQNYLNKVKAYADELATQAGAQQGVASFTIPINKFDQVKFNQQKDVLSKLDDYIGSKGDSSTLAFKKLLDFDAGLKVQNEGVQYAGIAKDLRTFMEKQPFETAKKYLTYGGLGLAGVGLGLYGAKKYVEHRDKKKTMKKESMEKIAVNWTKVLTGVGYAPGAVMGSDKLVESVKENGLPNSAQDVKDYGHGIFDVASNALLYNPVTLALGLHGLTSRNTAARNQSLIDLVGQKAIGGGGVALSNYLNRDDLIKEQIKSETLSAKAQEAAATIAAGASSKMIESSGKLNDILAGLGIGAGVLGAGALGYHAYHDKQKRDNPDKVIMQQTKQPTFRVKLNNPLRPSSYDPELEIPTEFLPASHQQKIRARLRDASRYL